MRTTEEEPQRKRAGRAEELGGPRMVRPPKMAVLLLPVRPLLDPSLRLLHPGIEPGSPALQVDSLLTELSGKPKRNGEGDIWEKTYKREWMSNVDTKENCNLGNVNSK